MPIKPALTVAIPIYNGAAFLEQALQSILAHEGPPFDLLICDDRSTDQSLEIVRKLAGSRARIEQSSQQLGLAKNWNRWVSLSKTDWVTVFHQDDLMLPGHLASHARAIQANLNAGIIAGPATAIDEQGRPVPPSIVAPDHLGNTARVYKPGEFLCELAVENPVRCSAVTIRREVHKKLKGFDSTLRYAVDWEFWARVAAEFPVVWTGEPTVSFRWHTGSETHRFKTGTQDLDEQMLVALKLFMQANFDPQEANRLMRACDLRLANGYLNRAYEASRAGNRPLLLKCLKKLAFSRPKTLLRCLTEPKLGARLLWGLVGGKG